MLLAQLTTKPTIFTTNGSELGIVPLEVNVFGAELRTSICRNYVIDRRSCATKYIIALQNRCLRRLWGNAICDVSLRSIEAHFRIEANGFASSQ